MRMTLIATFAGAALMGAVVSAASVATAAVRTIPPFGCMQQPGVGTGTLALNAYGQLANTSTVGSAEALCGLVNDTNGFDVRSSASTVYVDGWNNSNTANTWEAGCRTYYTGNGGTCGATTHNPASSVFHSVVNKSAWAAGNDSDYYYVSTILGPIVNGSQDNIFGVRVVQ